MEYCRINRKHIRNLLIIQYQNALVTNSIQDNILTRYLSPFRCINELFRHFYPNFRSLSYLYLSFQCSYLFIEQRSDLVDEGLSRDNIVRLTNYTCLTAYNGIFKNIKKKIRI